MHWIERVADQPFADKKITELEDIEVEIIKIKHKDEKEFFKNQ